MEFRIWLEYGDNFTRWKNLLLGYLGLDQNNGLSQPLDAFDSQNTKRRLSGLGEFTKLPGDVQMRVLSMFDEPQGGTVGDLIRMIASHSRMV